MSSGEKNGMRLLSVVMGTPSDLARNGESQKLLRWGFRFFESHQLYTANHTLNSPRVWMGKFKTVPVGIQTPLIVTIPSGAYSQLQATLSLDDLIKAPVQKGQALGTLTVKLGNKVLATRPLVSLAEDPTGSLWTRMKDYISLAMHKVFHHDSADTQAASAKA